MAPHGIQGAVKVKSFTQDPEGLCGYEVLYRADGQVLHPSSGRVLHADNLVMVFKEIKTRTEAEAMRDVYLHITHDQLPPLEEGEGYYYQDLEGLKVEAMDGRDIGIVQEIRNYGAGEVLEIMTGEGILQSLPFTEEAVREVRVTEGLIIIDPNFLC